MLTRRCLFLWVCIAALPLWAVSGRGQESAGQKRSGPEPSGKPLRVLFVGNSYTYFNNLPALVEKLAAASGDRIETGMLTEGGATLRGLWDKGAAPRMIRSKSWDHVVLQEQSTLGWTLLMEGRGKVGPPQFFHEAVRLYAPEIAKAGARLLFFQTWAREGEATREQAALDHAYFSIARELHAPVAPVGLAWQEARRARPGLRLYQEDHSHPRPAGSYLAACVFYATLLNKNPDGLPGQLSGHPVGEEGKVENGKEAVLVDLPEADARALQRAAWAAHERVRAAGGYPPAPEPPPPAATVRVLPEGTPAKPEELEGTWSGKFRLYPVPWEVRLELTLRREKGGWRADLRVLNEGHSQADRRIDVSGLTVTGGEVVFADARGANGVPMKFRAVLREKALVGRAEVKDPAKRIDAVATFELRRME